MPAQTTVDTSVSFLSLAAELRNRVYEVVLLQQDLIDPWFYVNQEQMPITSLLRANKTIYREASSVFYGQNRFDFTEATPEGVASFLKQVGSTNTGYIRYLSIEFPRFLYLDPGDVTITDDSISILENISRHCVNLSTLTTSLHSTNSMEIRLDNLENLKVATEALALVNVHFKAILSVTEVILEVFEEGPSQHIRRIMESHGWQLHEIEYAEEDDWNGNISDIDDDDDDWDDYGSAGDDYDIDNDSDFWRRAAD
ncbi:hypothetical protein LX32DRAFT_698534 [Colletotrichum zoysiae]|uniref:F-box domain-containing protein n=1 Tax=Colletotrichum zoysiae TaxID=1216348 RepID=A0AAD9H773_9PEZI|nr:hypothetical protein LX32DRAFT_698534 [Colletotrichum zoysiae]